MVEILKPKKLKKGDHVGIVATSSPIGSLESERFQLCLRFLEKLGLRYKIGKYVHEENDYMAGTPKQRAEDINCFFKDRDIKAIWCTNGGISSHLILDYLDYNLIKKNPKIFIGYSDVTSLNLAIFSRSNLLNFYGPNLSSYEEAITDKHEKYFDITLENLKKILFENEFNFEVEYSKTFFINNKHKRKIDLKVINHGKAEGVLIGGCSPLVFNVLLGTKFFIIPKNSILFLEFDLDDAPLIEAYLWKLEQLGIFNFIKGILLGKGEYKTTKCKTTTYDIFRKFGEKYNLPILVNLDIGHTEPMLTLPIGCRVEIDTSKETFILKERALED